MIRHGFLEPPSTLQPSAQLLKAMHALYWRDSFLGTCIAIAPRILITAGHHYNAVKDDVGDFTVCRAEMEEVHVEYASKNSVHDVLVLWVSKDLDFVALRGFLPPVHARVATVWLSLKWPHETVVSPGVVIESNDLSCVARGTVSTTGSSGAPVIDYFGDHIVVPMRTESVSVAHSGVEDTSKLYVSALEMIAGGVAGFSEHFIMFPFDTIKTRIQSGSASNIASVFRHMWQRERLVNFYRGVFPVLVSAVPAHGAYFGVYEAAKRFFGEESNISIAAAATCAVSSHDAVSTPFDVVKQRMQMDGGKQFASSWRCAQTLLEKEGVRALFVSLPTTITMNIPHFASYWIVYEGVLSFLGDGKRRDRETELTAYYVTAGILAGTLASVVSSPLDVVKTHLQLGREKSFYSAFSSIMRSRGPRGFFLGVSARIMYTAPSGAITMATYETTKNFLQTF